ncbi:MAG: alpha-hydroxy acid oxidase [Actinomycetota bacterium]|nr:alpha-hydroxy acid oxidase [Actinomycetota bacterium]
MVKRRLPRWSAFAPLLKPSPRGGTRLDRAMTRMVNVPDLRARAKRRIPRAVFDYVDGAAEDEISLARSRDLFHHLEFVPSVLRDVSDCDPSTTLLGVPTAYPFAFAPTGYTRMMHHEGEIAVARVAAQSGIAYALSTMATTTPEELALAVPSADRWFQLYVWRDRKFSMELVERARHAGFRTLILTVDFPVGGARLRDIRNGLTVPPALTMRTFLEGATHPNWWFDFLTTAPLSFATLESLGGTVAESGNELFDPSLNFDDLEWLRGQWDGPIVVKGIQNVSDARRVVDLGAGGVVLSNHGGRQLDRSPTPLRLIAPTVEALGDDAEVYIDGGIMNGADVVAAIALGAQACFVGRAFLYGLMAGGERGVARMVEIFAEDIVRTMQLLGVRNIAELRPDHVRLPRDDR